MADIPSRDDLERRHCRAESRFADIDGVRLHWLDEGPGDAPLTIVLLPGQWLGALDMDRWAAGLRDQFRVIRLDLPGQGLAGPFGDGDYAMPHYAAVLKAWAQDLGRYIVVGSSFGGMVGVLHASERPAGLAGLVLANASGLPRPGGAFVAPPDAPDGARPAAFFRDRLGALLRMPGSLTEEMIARVADLDDLPGRPREAALRARAFSSDPTLAALTRITVPVLLQWSTESTYLPPEMAERFAAALTATDATIRVHPGVGHLIVADAPDAVASEIRHFVENLT